MFSFPRSFARYRTLDSRARAAGRNADLRAIVGNATLDGTRYWDDGRQRNPTLLDYKLLTSADAPTIDAVFVENAASNGGPRGSKGVGMMYCGPNLSCTPW